MAAGLFSIVNISYGTAALKKNVVRKLMRAPKNPVGKFGAPGGHFGFSRWFGVPGNVELQVVSKFPHRCYAGISIDFCSYRKLYDHS